MASVGGAMGLTNQFDFRGTHDKLKEAEQKERMKRPRDNIDKIEAKQKDIKEIITHLNTIKTTTSDILSDKLLGEKNLKTEGKSVKVTVNKGVSPMEFNIDVKKLAVKDTYQTAAAENEEKALFSRMMVKYKDDKGEETSEAMSKASFTVKVGKEKFSIHVDNATSLNQLADKLKNAKNDEGKSLKDLINVKMIDTGKDGYRLMIGAAKSGIENSISFEIAGKGDKEKAFSEEVLKTLGLASSVAESEAKDQLKEAKEQLEKSLKDINAKELDIENFKNNVFGDDDKKEITLKTKSGSEFKIKKDTDFMNMQGEQLDAFYDYQRKAEMAQWAVENDIKITDHDKLVSVKDGKLQGLNDEQWKELEDKYLDAKASEWLAYLQSDASFKDMDLKADKDAIKNTSETATSTDASVVEDNKPSEGASTATSTDAKPAESAPEATEASAAESAEASTETNAAENAEASAGASPKESSEASAEASSEAGAAESTEASSKPDSAEAKPNEHKITKTTKFSELSAEDKQAFLSMFKKAQRAAFDAQVNVAKAQTNVEAKQKEAASNHIQQASDAEFTYEGITITRAENEIKDLVVGANIKLIKEGKTEVSLKSDSAELVKHLDEFVSAYNSLMNNINAATDFDKKTHKAKGTLIGVSEVNEARAALSKLIGKIDPESGMSLSNLGFTVNKGGILEFKKSKFQEAYDKNSQLVEKFLLGGTDYKELTHRGQKISQMPVISKGDLVINDKKIALDAEFVKRLNQIGSDGKKDVNIQKPTQEEYNAALLKAIKDADIAGISARIDNEGSLVLTSDGKQGINISGIDDKLLALGLKETKLKADGKKNKGIFDEFKDTIGKLTGGEGTLERLDASYSNQTKKLKEELDVIKEQIDKRYATLAAKISRYDVIINKYERMGQMIKGMTQAAFGKKD